MLATSHTPTVTRVLRGAGQAPLRCRRSASAAVQETTLVEWTLIPLGGNPYQIAGSLEMSAPSGN